MESIRHKISRIAVRNAWVTLGIALLITAVFGYGLFHVQAKTIFSDLFPKSHPFAKRKRIAVADLVDEELLLLEDGHCLRDQALDVCQLAGAIETRSFRATSLETLRQMVAGGVGITLLPALAVAPPVATSANVQIVRFSGTPPHRQVALFWRRSSALGPFLERLGRELAAVPKTALNARASG